MKSVRSNTAWLKWLFILSLLVNVFFLASPLVSQAYTKFTHRFHRNYSVVFFGDSHTYRVDWSTQLHRDDVKASGNPGFTTSHFLWLMDEQVIRYKPKTCFVEGGTNDVGVGIPLSRSESNYDSLLTHLVANHITPVVQSTLYNNRPPGDSTDNRRIDSLNNFLKDYCDRKHLLFLDLNTRLSENKRLKKEYTEDGIHLNDAGVAVWVSMVKGKLQ